VTRRRWLWLSGAVSGLLFVVLAIVDRRIQDNGGPGIVPFEVAGTTERAREILSEWGEDGRDAARLSLWIDFPYLVAYGAFFSLAAMAMRDAALRREWRRYARPGAVVALLPIAAAAFDAVEDVNLLLFLGGHADSEAPGVAMGFAIAKFVTLGIAALYLLAGLAALGRQRLGRRAGERAAEPG
jgi:hypothetical protein